MVGFDKAWWVKHSTTQSKHLKLPRTSVAFPNSFLNVFGNFLINAVRGDQCLEADFCRYQRHSSADSLCIGMRRRSRQMEF
jgi:hypothetical protein